MKFMKTGVNEFVNKCCRLIWSSADSSHNLDTPDMFDSSEYLPQILPDLNSDLLSGSRNSFFAVKNIKVGLSPTGPSFSHEVLTFIRVNEGLVKGRCDLFRKKHQAPKPKLTGCIRGARTAE